MPAKYDYMLERHHMARYKSVYSRTHQILNYIEHACCVQPVLIPILEELVHCS